MDRVLHESLLDTENGSIAAGSVGTPGCYQIPLSVRDRAKTTNIFTEKWHGKRFWQFVTRNYLSLYARLFKTSVAKSEFLSDKWTLVTSYSNTYAAKRQAAW